MNKLQALHSFWAGFNIPAYDENTVPEEKERISKNGTAYPYLTYEAKDDDFGNEMPATINLYYFGSSWAGVTEKEMEIANAITRGGKYVKYDGGAVLIRKASPWAQRLEDANNEMIRRIVLNTTIEFLE